MSPRAAPARDQLRLRGLRAGNLRELDLDLPHGAWTAIHGPSGAGKSALLFGVLEPVARRRFRVLEDPRALPDADESWLGRVAREVSGLTPVIAGAGEIPRGRRRSTLGAAWGLWDLLERAWRRDGEHACAACGAHWAPWSPAALVAGCANLAADAPVLVFSAADGEASADLLHAGWTRARLAADGPLARLEEAPEFLPHSSWLLLDRLRWSPTQAERLREALEAALRRGRAARLEAGGSGRDLPAARRCPSCGVERAEDAAGPPGPRHPGRWLHGRPWDAWAAAPLTDWLTWCAPLGGLAARRVALLEQAGVGHLAAERELGSLSLGEARRIELTSWLALVRSGQTVLLDEPGMGLHGRERLAVAALLQRMAADGNTVLTADPAREFLEAAHGWVLLGPGGGPDGGRLVAQGARAALPAEPLPLARAARAGAPPAALTFRDLRARHLTIPELALPLGRVVAICGPSGCGKSTLLEDELLPRLRAGSGFAGQPPAGGVGVLLERALRWSPVSTVATLSGAWEEIRATFADGEEARMRGLTPSDLVAQPGRGACADCGGRGADEAGVPCGACEGLGLRADLLDLRWRTRALREWLQTPLIELERRLPSDRRLPSLVRHLVALGLGPRHFGERGRHLSLGERSRIALARALAATRADVGRLFVLDEPCLGLPHPEAQRVSDLLHALAARGHSFWVVEHHEVFLRQADHVVEIGPGAGAAGGRLLFSGAPADLEALNTPTAEWWRARAQGGRAPRPTRVAPPRSRALPDGWAGAGRAELAAALRRELALRSPLAADGDDLTDEAQADGAPAPSHPVAWPVAPDPRATLGAVLGLASLLPELRRRGAPRCAACGGGGAWRDLREACAARGDAEWAFAAPLPETLLTRPELPQWLQAAGFRRLWRAGQLLRAERGAALAPRAGDAVWLDQLRPLADSDGADRLRDLEHHLQALGAESLHVFSPAQLEASAWTFVAGACRDCGRSGAGSAVHLGGWNLERLDERRLDEVLAHARTHAPDVSGWERAASLLESSSLLARPFGAAVAGLPELEGRLARTVGWLLFPPCGATLLLDQPLAGFPTPLARRLAAALLQPPPGAAFHFTDAEGHAAPTPTPKPARSGVGRASTAPPPLKHPQAFDLAFEFSAWCAPPRAPADATLRDALGLAAPLRQHFLRTEGARRRGWSVTDLDPARSPLRCPTCHGTGRAPAHPALHVACRSCRGAGFEPLAGSAEDRGLRWLDLGRSSVRDLAAHFAESPDLALPLQRALEFGLGAAPLDAPLHLLPLAARSLAPLAALAAPGAVQPPALRIGLAAAGLNALEARALASTMESFARRAPGFEWREQHPALAAAP